MLGARIFFFARLIGLLCAELRSTEKLNSRYFPAVEFQDNFRLVPITDTVRAKRI